MKPALLLAVALLLAIGTLVLMACEDNGVSPAPTTPTAEASPTPPSTTTPGPATLTPRPAASTAEPSPQQARQPIWAISQRESGAQVQMVLEDGLNEYVIASVDPEVSRFERWEVGFVVDVNADGVVDVIVSHFTGGAHCCLEYLIFSEGPAGILLIDSFLLGNNSIQAVKDLDGDGMPELETADDRLAYFPDLSYAESPTLPLILCRTADRIYHNCTIRFPEVLRNSAQEFEGQLREVVARQATEQEKRPPALGLLASYVVLVEEDEGWSRVRSVCPECEAWLRENYDELDRRLGFPQPYRTG